MSVIRPRNRLVYFRVSEDEFKQFSQACKTAGARSISDLARSAMEQIVRQSKMSREDEVAQRLRVLDEIIAELNNKIHQLNVLLAGSADDGNHVLPVVVREEALEKGIANASAK